MKECFISLFYKFDLIGQTPQLYIFGHNRYKSSFSLILSIILIIFSAAFTLYSLILYFKFSTPTIRYSKSSDAETKRSIDLEDSFFMFQLIDSNSSKKIDESIFSYQGTYIAIYDNGTILNKKLYIEKCDIEKNINYRFRDALKKRLNFEKPVEEFYCISPKSGKLPLFYIPDIGYSMINLAILINNNITTHIPEKISSLIVSENDIIDHNNKNKPINENFIYHVSSGFNYLEYTEIKYNLQYIKYESDNGFFFPANKNFSGISFSSITYNKWKNDDSNSKDFGSISIEMNKSHFDYYIRSYQKLQSLLAEIMSVISILFEVGKKISIILCNKKMCKDIISYILYPDKSRNSTQQNHNVKLINIQKNSNKNNSEQKIIKSISLDRNNNNDNDNNENIIKCSSTIKDEIVHKIEYNNNANKKSIQVLKKINYYNILKSYFCFKDKKIKLINICHNIISEDICIERILKRLYDLDKIDYCLTNKHKEKINSFKNKRFEEIIKCIEKINKKKKKKNKK
jgi:hypothetical protein